MAQYASIARPAEGSLIAAWAADPHGTLQMTGAEAPLVKEEQDLLDGTHRFAADVMRPIGERLDRMTPEEVIGADSPLWQVFGGFGQLGIGVDQLLAFEPAQAAKVACLILEELGWGDAGLASSLGVSMFPRWMAASFGNQYLLELTPGSKLGCWATTEPGHGSDQLDPNRQIFHPAGEYGRPDCVATLSPERVLINGRKADWISNGTIAQVCILYCAADTGSGPDPERGCVVIVPMDAPGVSRGAPLDKLGQRALNQGAVIFDNVVLPASNVLAGPDDYQRAAYQVLSIGNACMGAIFVGTARAAYELALGYAHERKQGGVPIAAHQNVAYRLFHMYRKVEAARALARRAMLYNFTQPVPALQVAMASKITATQAAFEVASEALQIFSGAGIRRDQPIEKIFRDARLSMIEDGCNEILAIKGGMYLTASP
ncbi:MAG TPA: acyl-CoA dehydrogenase [Streptosporangiaceae bacterium]